MAEHGGLGDKRSGLSRWRLCLRGPPPFLLSGVRQVVFQMYPRFGLPLQLFYVLSLIFRHQFCNYYPHSSCVTSSNVGLSYVYVYSLLQVTSVRCGPKGIFSLASTPLGGDTEYRNRIFCYYQRFSKLLRTKTSSHLIEMTRKAHPEVTCTCGT